MCCVDKMSILYKDCRLLYFQHLFTGEIQVLIKVNVVLESPLGLLKGPTVPSSCPISGLLERAAQRTTVAFNST